MKNFERSFVTDSEIDFYCRKILDNAEVLDKDSERELAKYIGKRGKKAKEAREKLIASNLKLVVKIAREYSGLGLALQDLISECNMGVMKAVDKYKPTKGAKLSYYASFWIKQSIMRALSNKGRTIRLPVGATAIQLKILKFRKDYQEKNGNQPELSEIARAVGVSKQRVINIEEGGTFTLSLNQPLMSSSDDSSDNELGDVVCDHINQAPDSTAAFASDVLLLKKFIKKLPSREQKIMEYRFGMHGDKPKTLEKIGVEFKISRERVRQLEWRAMNKLKMYFTKELRIRNGA